MCSVNNVWLKMIEIDKIVIQNKLKFENSD